MYGFFSLGWVTVLAVIQGLIQPRGIFLRTEKSPVNSKMIQGLQVTTWEAGLGVLCLAAGVAAIVLRPGPNTAFLAGLLAWQSSLFLAAPVLSLVSVYAGPRGADREAPQGAPVRENLAARWAVALAVVVVAAVLAVQLSRPLETAPSYTQFQPPAVPAERLVGKDRVPIKERKNYPSQTPAGKSKQDNKPSPGKGNGKP
jgi:hypothetical protein